MAINVGDEVVHCLTTDTTRMRISSCCITFPCVDSFDYYEGEEQHCHEDIVDELPERDLLVTLVDEVLLWGLIGDFLDVFKVLVCEVKEQFGLVILSSKTLPLFIHRSSYR